MKTLLLILSIILIAVIFVQVGRLTDLSSKVRGEKPDSLRKNNATAVWLMVFMVGFLVFCIGSAWYYKDSMLAYGPNKAASIHGESIDGLFNVTLFFTGIVFVITQVALFYFAYKYRMKEGRVAKFFSHDNKLEIVWTLIPAIVMAFLVVQGIVTWNEAMADVEDGEDVLEIEATGEQWLWHLRYPGPDGLLGERDFRLTSGTNQLGQNWKDAKNHDDFFPDRIVLPVNQKVRVRIMAKDVIHSFYLPHQRVKMDAVPGIPSFFVFTPTITTDEYRQRLKGHPDWEFPSDPSDPKSPSRWKVFDYELACAELCGQGHFSMRKVVEIVTEEEYAAWLETQNSYYQQNIRNKDSDPYKGQLLDIDLESRKSELMNAFNEVKDNESVDERIIRLKYVQFETASSALTADSRFELNNVVELLKENKSMTLELGGHTDNTGVADSNMSLSQSRAESVLTYLKSKGVGDDRLTARGYGQNVPTESNGTEKGRAENRRTEFKIITL